MAPKVTSELLRQLRQAMRNTEYVTEPIQAYIIPSGDAHQVLSGDGLVMDLISLSSVFILFSHPQCVCRILVVSPQLSMSSRGWHRDLCLIGSHRMLVDLALASLFPVNIASFQYLVEALVDRWRNRGLGLCVADTFYPSLLPHPVLTRIVSPPFSPPRWSHPSWCGWRNSQKVVMDLHQQILGVILNTTFPLLPLPPTTITFDGSNSVRAFYLWEH